MDDINILQFSMPQDQYNTLFLQLLLEINSRHLAIQKYLAELIAQEKGLTLAEAFDLIEKDATAFRVDFVSALQGQFGHIPSEIFDLLKKPPDRNSP